MKFPFYRIIPNQHRQIYKSQIFYDRNLKYLTGYQAFFKIVMEKRISSKILLKWNFNNIEIPFFFIVKLPLLQICDSNLLGSVTINYWQILTYV